MLFLFTNLSLMEFQVRYLAIFLLFSVIDGFEWFWMDSLHKNIQLMLEFLKGPFLLSVILLSMLMILLSILSAISHQQLELASELEFDLQDTVDWGRKWVVDFSA